MSNWHNFNEFGTQVKVAYNADVVQCVTIDWNHLAESLTYLAISEQFQRLRDLPNVLVIIQEKDAADIRYTVFVTGFTAEQSQDGGLRRWVEQQMAGELGRVKA